MNTHNIQYIITNNMYNTRLQTTTKRHTITIIILIIIRITVTTNKLLNESYASLLAALPSLIAQAGFGFDVFILEVCHIYIYIYIYIHIYIYIYMLK